MKRISLLYFLLIAPVSVFIGAPIKFAAWAVLYFVLMSALFVFLVAMRATAKITLHTPTQRAARQTLNLPDGVIGVSDDGCIVYGNPEEFSKIGGDHE